MFRQKLLIWMSCSEIEFDFPWIHFWKMFGARFVCHLFTFIGNPHEQTAFLQSKSTCLGHDLIWNTDLEKEEPTERQKGVIWKMANLFMASFFFSLLLQRFVWTRWNSEITESLSSNGIFGVPYKHTIFASTFEPAGCSRKKRRYMLKCSF